MPVSSFRCLMDRRSHLRRLRLKICCGCWVSVPNLGGLVCLHLNCLRQFCLRARRLYPSLGVNLRSTQAFQPPQRTSGSNNNGHDTTPNRKRSRIREPAFPPPPKQTNDMMKTLQILTASLAVANAFFTPPAIKTGMRPTMSVATAKFDTAALFRPMAGHGGGIIMGGGGDGEGTGGGGGGGGGQGGGDANKGGDNPLVAFWKGYNKMLKDQPLFTKALTSFVGFSAGDFLAQKFIDKADEVDLKRLLKLALFGFLVHGPTGHFFYGALDGKIPGTDAVSVATKVGIDQLLWNPIFGTMFFGYLGLAEGQDLQGIKARIEKDLWTSVKGSWTVWPIAHAINFRFIPNSQRLLYINSIQIGYNCFLSFLANRGAAEPAAVPAKM